MSKTNLCIRSTLEAKQVMLYQCLSYKTGGILTAHHSHQKFLNAK